MMRTLSICILALMFISGCNHEKNQLKPNERKSYFKNGILKMHFYVDQHGKLHGKYKEFDVSGEIKMDAFFFHGDELMATFYTNGIKTQQRSSRFNPGEVEGFNTLLIFDDNGELDKKQSFFAHLRYKGKEQDSLEIEMSNFYTDSIVVRFCSQWPKDDHEITSTRIIREVVFSNLKYPKMKIELQQSDYVNNKINIAIYTYDKSTGPVDLIKSGIKIHLNPVCKKMLVQLKKGEIPKKYNLEPIW